MSLLFQPWMFELKWIEYKTTFWDVWYEDSTLPFSHLEHGWVECTQRPDKCIIT